MPFSPSGSFVTLPSRTLTFLLPSRLMGLVFYFPFHITDEACEQALSFGRARLASCLPLCSCAGYLRVFWTHRLEHETILNVCIFIYSCCRRKRQKWGRLFSEGKWLFIPVLAIIKEKCTCLSSYTGGPWKLPFSGKGTRFIAEDARGKKRVVACLGRNHSKAAPSGQT